MTDLTVPFSEFGLFFCFYGLYSLTGKEYGKILSRVSYVVLSIMVEEYNNIKLSKDNYEIG